MMTPPCSVPRRRGPAVLLLALATTLAACAGATRRPDQPALEPGRYSFDGSAQVTHDLHDRRETSVIQVSGVMDVGYDGDIEIMSSSGSCSRRGTGILPASVSLSCGPASFTLGPGAGSARLRTQQRYSQQIGCEEWVLDAQGRPTGRCARVSWRERQRVITVTVPLSVVRTSGG